MLASSATFMSSLGFGALNMEIGFLEKENGEAAGARLGRVCVRLLGAQKGAGEYCSELVGCGQRHSPTGIILDIPT